MNQLIVPSHDSIMIGVLRIYCDTPFKPLAAINIQAEITALFSKLDAKHTHNKNTPLPDNVTKILQFIAQQDIQ